MRNLFIATATLFIPVSAWAHTGVGETSGLVSGFLHPAGGLDHVLAMVAVGFLAFLVGGRALWLVPMAFVGMMALGGALGLFGVQVPYVELGIGISIVAIGAASVFGQSISTGAAMALVGFFAVFHGHAHGSEMPQAAAAISYALGFMATTALLHGAGIAAGFATARVAGRYGGFAARAGGGAVALAGCAILGGML